MGCGSSSAVADAAPEDKYTRQTSSLNVASASTVHAASRSQILENDIARTKESKPRRRMTSVMPEFRAHMKRFEASMDHPLLSEPRLKKIFAIIDDDGNGVLDVDEISSFWKRMGWASSEASIRTMFGIADGDGNGRIDYREFSKFFRSLSSLEDLTLRDPDRDMWSHPQQSAKTQKLSIRHTSCEYGIGHSDRVAHIAVDPIRGVYASCGSIDRDVSVFGMCGTQHRSFRRHTGPVFAMCLSEGAKMLATCGQEGMLYVWNFMSGVLVAEVVSGLLTALTFGKNDGLLYGGCEFGTIVAVFIRNPSGNFRREPVGRGAVSNLLVIGDMLAASVTQESAIYLLNRDLVTSKVLPYHDAVPMTLAVDESKIICLSVCSAAAHIWTPSRGTSRKPHASFTLSDQNRSNMFANASSSSDKHHTIKSVPREASLLPSSPASTYAESASWLAGIFLSGHYRHYICLACNDRCLYFFNADTQTLDWTMETQGLTYELAWCDREERVLGGDISGNIFMARINGSMAEETRRPGLASLKRSDG